MTVDTRDMELQDLGEKYEHETDEELRRKRDVCRTNIVKGTQDEIQEKAADIGYWIEANEILSEIIRKREKARLRRENGREILMWIGGFTPFVLGVLARPWFDDLFRSMP